MLQFKIGTGPLCRHEVKDYPMVGDRIDLPWPNGGTNQPVRITRIDFALTLEKSLFIGEWM